MVQTNAPPLVLVADDEPSMLELVARHLKSLEKPHLDVIEASDGEEAWRLAREHLPDLVVLDVMMPGMSGWEVCRKIREDVALAHTGVVMLTGIGENLNHMTSPLYGADAYIDKPFDFGELDDKVREALQARAVQREAVARPVRNGVGGPARAAVSPETSESGEEREHAKRGRKKNAVKGKAKMAAKKSSAKKSMGAAKKATGATSKSASAAKKAAGSAKKATAAKRGAVAKKAAGTAKRGVGAKTAAKKTGAKKTAAKKTTAKRGAAPARKVAKKAAAPAKKTTRTAKKVAKRSPGRPKKSASSKG